MKAFLWHCGHGSLRKSVLGRAFQDGSRLFKATPYAVSVIWNFERKLFLTLSISAILGGLWPAASVWIMRYFLDAVVNAFQHPGQAEFVRKAVWMLFLQAAVTGGFAVVTRSIAYFQSVLSSKLSLDMQIGLNKNMSSLEMKDYDDPQVYDMLVRAKSEAQGNRPLAIVSAVSDMVSSFITWLSFSIILLRFSPLVVCAMFLIAIPYFILNLYFAKASFHLQYNRAHDQRVANYLSSSFTDRRSLPEIITRDLWLFLQSKWSALANKFMQQDISLLKRRNRSESAIIGFTYAGYGGVNLYIILKCLLSVANCTVGQVIMYIQSFSGGVSASTQIMQKLSAVYEGSCYMQNYQEFLERQNAANHKTRTPGEVPDEIDSIECREVSFIYPGAPTYALQNVSLVFRKGESTLLVGSNGAGKTTLARLLVGLYTPTGGQILINGRDMQDYDLTLLRKRMSIIFQDFVRYALTAEENIALGSIEGMEDKKRIVTAATAARLDKIIARLPNGYATMLGKEFRDGQDLSLGEWQRVCLARLFMRNASVMIYDEPSASLDIETESELLREINASALNKICVLISHRMLRADIADRIVVIEEGKVVEKGSHNALVNLDGRYARLWKMYHQLGGNGESNGDHNILARSVCK